MPIIRGYVERPRKEDVGFECGLCHNSFRFRRDVKEYKTEWESIIDISEWPVNSFRAYLNYDHPDGEGPVHVEFCRDCYYRLRDHLKEMGAKIENDG